MASQSLRSVIYGLCVSFLLVSCTNIKIETKIYDTAVKQAKIQDKRIFVSTLGDASSALLITDQSMLITKGPERTVSLWDFKSMRILNRFTVGKNIVRITYDEQEKQIYAVVIGGVYRIDPATGTITPIPNSFEHPSVTLNAPRPFMLTTEKKNVLAKPIATLVDLRAGKVVWTQKEAFNIAISDNGEYFAVGRRVYPQTEVQTYRTSTRELVSSFNLNTTLIAPQGSFYRYSLSNDGTRLLLSEYNNQKYTTTMYDPRTGSAVATLSTELGASYQFAPNQTYFIEHNRPIGSPTGTTSIRSSATGELLKQLSGSPCATAMGNGSFALLNASDMIVLDAQLTIKEKRPLTSKGRPGYYNPAWGSLTAGHRQVNLATGVLEDWKPANVPPHITEGFHPIGNHSDILYRMKPGELVIKKFENGKAIKTFDVDIPSLHSGADTVHVMGASDDASTIMYWHKTGAPYLADLENKLFWPVANFASASYRMSKFLKGDLLVVLSAQLNPGLSPSTVLYVDIVNVKTKTKIASGSKKMHYGTSVLHQGIERVDDEVYIFTKYTHPGDERVLVFDLNKQELSSPKTLNNMHDVSYFSMQRQRGKNALVFHSQSGDIDVYSVPDLTKTATLEGHSHIINMVEVDAQTNNLITSSHDGTIILWDPDTYKHRATIYALSNGEWVTLTPEGYYVSSARGHASLNLALPDGQTYSMDQFYDVFFRPDIVAHKLQGNDIVPLVGLTIDDVIKSPPPQVEIASIPGTTDQADFLLNYKVTDQGGGIGEIRVFHNGKLVKSDGYYKAIVREQTQLAALDTANSRSLYAQQRGINIKPQGIERVVTTAKQQLHKDSIALKLTQGENELSVCAFNADNTIQGVLQTVRISADVPAAEPKLHILGIGVDQYTDSRVDLKYAAKDASDLVSKLQTVAEGQFKPENIHTTLLSNREVTKHAVLAAIEKLEAEVGPADTMVIFFAGHGVLLENQYYFVTTEYAGHMDKSCLLSSNEIVDISKRLPALNQILIFDTCHAGGVDYIITGLYDARMAVMAKKLGLHLFASCNSVQQALDGYKDNGLFTYHLLQGLSVPKVDTNNDKQVSIKELGVFTKTETTSASSAIGHPQTPTVINFGKDSPLYRIQ